MLTLSAVLPYLRPSDCQNSDKITSCSPPQIPVIFFFSLYLVAVGEGGHKPCIQAFGADQFDGNNPEECKAKSSFFNWWYFSQCTGSSVTMLILSYIQDNFNWGVGFGIPNIVMVVGLILFFLGTKTYRYGIKGDEKSPFLRIRKMFVAVARNWQTTPMITKEDGVRGTLLQQGSHQFK